MKTLLTLIVLLFSSSVVAENISDFEIEGISIGDSLLDYFSEDEINNNLYFYNSKTDKTFIHVEFYNHSIAKVFEGLQFAMKNKDNEYKVHSIRGAIYYDNVDFNLCYEKMYEISNELSKLFVNAEKIETNVKHSYDKTGKSTVRGFAFLFERGLAYVQCYNWSEEITKDEGWDDNLNVTIKTDVYNNWLK
tara:strand:+ start:38 stop:610 length:573 start_codon:yes stop_codon:yes gene_type:complete